MASPRVSATTNPVTTTEEEQLDVEKTLHRCFDLPTQPLHRDAHIRMLRTCIAGVAERFQGLHCSRPWLCYWILHAADLLGALDDVFATTAADRVADFIVSLCLTEDEASSEEAADPVLTGPAGEGRRCGFGGGPGQSPHLAASYAAACTLAICQHEPSVRKVDRDGLQRWLVSLRSADGGFRMHRGGEVDLRASFCAAVVATFFDLDMAAVFPPEARSYIAASQTYEGGFCSCLDGGGEAHGGYTQCGAAAAIILGVATPASMDLPNLERFCAMRQLEFEGGYCGRANKLVDSCYSFWVGASAMMGQAATAYAKLARQRERGGGEADRLTAPEVLLLEYVQLIDLGKLSETDAGLLNIDAIDAPRPPVPADVGADEPSVGDLHFDQQELMHYVLQCCQQAQSGGLQDKPSAGVDFYHTCYSLSGLSIASNNLAFAAADTPLLKEFHARGWLPTNNTNGAALLGLVAGGAVEEDVAPPPESSAADGDGASPSSRLQRDLFASLVQPYAPPPEEADGMVGDAAARAMPRPAGPPSLRRRKTPKSTIPIGAIPPPSPPPPAPQLLLRPVNPVFNICRDKAAWMWRLFRGPAAPMAIMPL